MIKDKDRSYWIGASDSDKVMMNRSTKTFKQWWMVKLGIATSNISTKPMKVGNAYEHKIMKAINIKPEEMDNQIIIPELNLRVNYDGLQGDHIYEIKTYAKDSFKVSKAYLYQAQAEMFAYFKKYGVVPKHTFVAYRVTENDYLNYFNDIDLSRITWIDTAFDEYHCKIYESKLLELKEHMKNGTMPR